MSDAFGALALPADVGSFDHALDNLLAFTKAVLLAQLRAAWKQTADTSQIITEATPCIPAHGGKIAELTEHNLPALFAWRPKGTFEELAGGFVREEAEILVAWVFPALNPEKRARFDRVAGPLGKALAAALSDGRHPAWLHDADKAVPEAIRLAAAAPTVDTVYEGADLDGAIGAAAFPAPRRVLFTFSAGNWDTAAPLVVEGELEDGTAWTDTVTPTLAGGGETIETPWIFSTVTRVTVPGQPSGPGTLAIGTALAAAAEYGSEIHTRMGASNVRCASWQRDTLRQPMSDLPPKPFDMILMRVTLQENRSRTGSALNYPLLAAATGGIAHQSQIVSLGGLTVETENE